MASTNMNKLKPVLFAIAVVVLAACGRQKGEAPSGENALSDSTTVALTDEQSKNANLAIGHIEMKPVHGLVKANGMLDVPPQNLVTISAPIGGFVKSTDLLQGMKVQKGQILVTLEHSDYIQLQQDYLDLKSQLQFEQEEYTRQEALSKENVNAVKSLQAARAAYASTKARVQGLEAKLKLININPEQLEKGSVSSTIQLYSPITGFITQVNVNLGMHVDPSLVMFRIVDNSHLHAEAQVYERDVSHLKIGQVVRFTLSKDTQERTARVYLIGKEVNQDRTVRVHCHLDHEDPSLIPGMYFNAEIETDDATVATLPSEAVVKYENRSYVFVAKEARNNYEMVEVKTGNSADNYVEVVLPGRLQSDVGIVTHGAYELLGFLKNRGE